MKKNFHRVGLLLGSNIQPEINIPLAVTLLQKSLARITISSVWESRAVGSDGANFLNAALLASTGLDADALKTQVLRPIETQLGRVRTSDKNAPRTIDLDILIFDQTVLEPGLWLYAFRAVPLAEIMPDIQSQTGEALRDAAMRLANKSSIWVRKDVTFDPYSRGGEMPARRVN